MTIVEELKKVNQNAWKDNIQIPTYLYFEKYGRNIESDMETIARQLGCNDWLMFYADAGLYQNGILKGFMSEIDKNKGLGKEYEGLVYIKFTGDFLSNNGLVDVDDFVAFLYRNRDKYTYVFSSDNVEYGEMLRKVLVQYDCIRVNEAAPYTREEMEERIDQIFFNMGIEIAENARDALVTYCVQKEWNENDHVLNIVECIILNHNFNTLMLSDEEKVQFHMEDAKECINSITALTRVKRAGFVLE